MNNRLLQAAIESNVPVYADLSDPLEYLEAALAMHGAAKAAGTAAVVCAGAFPGFSNVIAAECASRLTSPARDVRFSYFTAGLGGAGTVNLYITNLGFGDPVWTLRGGKRAPREVGGLDSTRVDFFLDEADESFRRIGTQTVWAWPFPEVCTVGETLGITGRSDVRMGTAPHVWNVILGAMARVVPRAWWRDERFSRALAAFSQPMVALTDRFVGETHGMRIDVRGDGGETVTAVQAHDSFRVCVGQSCAEFVCHLLQRADSEPTCGVFLPEQLLADRDCRQQVLQRMSQTPGTFGYRIHHERALSALKQ